MQKMIINNKNNNKLKCFYIGVIIFIIAYAPPLLKFDLSHIVAIIALASLIFSNVKLDKKIIFLIFSQIVLFVTYVIFSRSNISFSMIYLNYIKILEVVIIAFYLSNFCKKNNFKKATIIKILIIVALFQAILSFLAFINDDIKLFFVSFLKNTTTTQESVENSLYRRAFGFAGNFTFAMPVFQATVASLVLYCSIKYNKFLLSLLIIPILFSAIINARISIVIFGAVAFAELIYLIIIKKDLKLILKFLLFGFIFSLLILAIIPFLKKYSLDTYDWIIEFFEDTVSLFNGEKEGNYEVLKEMFNVNLFGKDLLFGIGRFILNEPYNGFNSDIGFINYIYYGGVFYSILLYAFNLFILYSIFKDNKNLGIIMFFVLIISNMKGIIFVDSSIMFVVYLFYFLASKNKEVVLYAN